MRWCQKVPQFDIKSQFSISNIIGVYLIYFIKEYQIKNLFFCYWHFLKWCPILDNFPSLQSSKFNNFLWVSWFLGNKSFLFCSPCLKTQQPILPYVVASELWDESPDSSYDRVVSRNMRVLGPLHVFWQVSFGCWVTRSISNWQKNCKSVFFPKVEWISKL